MNTTAAVGQELSEMTALEQRRVQLIKAGDGRLVRAEKRAAATEARIAECQREHDDACAREEPRLSQEVAKVRSQTERMVKDIQARERAAREKHEAVEAQTRQLLAETEAVRANNEEMRLMLQQEVATIDKHVESTLCGTSKDLRSLSTGAEEEVRGILDPLSAETARVWSLEDRKSFARELTGARTLDYAPDPVPPREVLPFGSVWMPFEGYGSFGSKPPRGPPRSFKEDTSRRLEFVMTGKFSKQSIACPGAV